MLKFQIVASSVYSLSVQIFSTFERECLGKRFTWIYQASDTSKSQRGKNAARKHDKLTGRVSNYGTSRYPRAGQRADNVNFVTAGTTLCGPALDRVRPRCSRLVLFLGRSEEFVTLFGKISLPYVHDVS